MEYAISAPAGFNSLIKRDPNAYLDFCSVQSDTGKVLLNAIGLPTEHIEAMTYIRNDNIYLRSTALLEILSTTWSWLFIGLHVPQQIRDSIYNFIAKNRYRIATLPNDATLTDYYRHYIRWWYAFGWPAFIAVIMIFYLMVLKPS